MEMVASVVEVVNKFLWDYALLILLLGTGIFYSFRLKFIQVRKFGAGMKKMFGGFSLHGKSSENGLSSFQALATAIAAQVGTGNIAGAATAIASGGSGRDFLDVGQRLFRNGNHLCRGCYGAAHQGKGKRCDCGRSCILHQIYF